MFFPILKRPCPNESLSLDEAQQISKHKTARPIKDAVRRGELASYGNQRNRTVKRGELLVWLENRRRATTGPDDADIERRMERLRADQAHQGRQV